MVAASWFKRCIFYFAESIGKKARDHYKGDCLVYKYDYDSDSRYIVLDPRSSEASRKYNKEAKLKIKSPDYGDTLGQAGYIYSVRNRDTQEPTMIDRAGHSSGGPPKANENKWERRARELMARSR